ncbi:hypothetical protein [Flavobacterium sp. N3904]|uniref:hypothetical protein n=1 Tax=Flavobacterium sp. N3904 TaxID=2986835 RepID=UPI002224B167|nr:hypothetical protein [Flavobacterium sp. N3904]
MKTFWKFIVIIGLFMQFSFAYSANQYAIPTFQKENNSSLSKESLSSSHFIQPSVDRGALDLKHNNRISVDLSDCTLSSLLFSSFKENNPKIAVFDQDIDRCSQVSILLFPFHFFW